MPGRGSRDRTNAIVSERLALVPASVALCDAEDRGAADLGQELGAVVPSTWPPPVFEPDDVARVRRQLIADPTTDRWTPHYVLRLPASAGELPALVGVAGWVAPPTGDGVVEIGYAIVPEFQRAGLATEAVRMLLGNAFADRRVRVVVATTYASLHPSIRVLQKSGFVEALHERETGLMRFECRCDAWVASGARRASRPR